MIAYHAFTLLSSSLNCSELHMELLQTKETLTLRASSFGSKCDVSDAKFLKKLEACGITDLVNAFATFKNEKELKKTDGAKRSRITGETPANKTHSCGIIPADEEGSPAHQSLHTTDLENPKNVYACIC